MRILIADDHPLLSDAVRQVCLDGGHEVVGVARRGADLIVLAREQRPELIVLDIGLPDLDGLEAAAQVRRGLPLVRFLALTASLDDCTIYRASRFGLHGFLDKCSNAMSHLGEAIASIAAGNTYFSPAYQQARLALRTNTCSFEKVLTQAEQSILALIGEGMSDQEIGDRLGISPYTAQTHRSSILRKLSIPNTPKLVAYAINRGFTRVPSRAPF